MIWRVKVPWTGSVWSGLVPLHGCRVSRGRGQGKTHLRTMMTRDLGQKRYEPDQVCCWVWLQPPVVSRLMNNGWIKQTPTLQFRTKNVYKVTSLTFFDANVVDFMRKILRLETLLSWMDTQLFWGPKVSNTAAHRPTGPRVKWLHNCTNETESTSNRLGGETLFQKIDSELVMSWYFLLSGGMLFLWMKAGTRVGSDLFRRHWIWTGFLIARGRYYGMFMWETIPSCGQFVFCVFAFCVILKSPTGLQLYFCRNIWHNVTVTQ